MGNQETTHPFIQSSREKDVAARRALKKVRKLLERNRQILDDYAAKSGVRVGGVSSSGVTMT